jgi:hypothetical protein
MTKSRTLRGARHVALMVEVRNDYSILVVKPEGKKLQVRPRID